MNSGGQGQDLFLLDQQLLRLSDDVPLKHRRYHVCGDGQPPKERKKETEKPTWERTTRLPPIIPDNKLPLSLVACAMGDDPWKRVALVCEAGLGKTTNMRWLQRQLSERGSRGVPLLLQLHVRSELDLLLSENEEPDALLCHLAKQVAGDDKNVDRHLLHLKKLQKQGRITLLIDGLDHGLFQAGGLPSIIDKMLKNAWASCPVWISGRANVFSLAWDLFDDWHWTFLHVQGLGVSDIRFYLDEQVEPDPNERTKNDWFMALPEDGRELLAIPRFLLLVTGEVRDEVADAKKAGADPLRAIEELELHTRADVYRLAYFSRGEDVGPRYQILGKEDRREKRGLIAQGLDACYEFRDGQTQYLGLKKGEPSDDKKLGRRIRFTAALLGAIAFELYANPHKYGAQRAQGKQMPLQPNTAGIPETEMEAFEDAVRGRLLATSPIFKAECIDNAFLILGANNRTVDYVMFHELRENGLAWHDPTVQAFFAAYWAMNYASAEELNAMDRWKVVLDEEKKRLEGFNEFWQFAAEMPDQLVYDPGKSNWFTTFKPSYTPPHEFPGDDEELVQWHRRMIGHSFVRMDERSRETIESWRSLWFTLVEGNGNKAQQAIYDQIQTGFRRCPKDPNLDGKPVLLVLPKDDDEIQREVTVKPIAMQDFSVTNAQYEVFDSKHREKRDQFSNGDEEPVIYVTFWDAWCFAQWAGSRLPTEAEWELACCAGTTKRYHLGDITNYEEYVSGFLTATWKGKQNKPANAWELFGTYDNVLEWCNTQYEAGESERVVRGSSDRKSRLAFRFRSKQDGRSYVVGLHYAAILATLEPNKPRAKRNTLVTTRDQY